MASSDSTSASPESRAIRCHFSSLAKAITDPLGLSMELYSKEIIEANTKEAVKLSGQILTEKNDTLLSAVERRVEARPNLFRKFVDILKDSGDDILRELGAKLETTYKEQNSPTTKHVDCPTPPPAKQSDNQPPLPTQRVASPLIKHSVCSPPSPTQQMANHPERGVRRGRGRGVGRGGRGERKGEGGGGVGRGRRRGGREILEGWQREGGQQYPMKQIESPPPLPPRPLHPSLLPPPPQSPVCRYANYLRVYYQTSELPVCDKFPPTPSTTFINLAFIGREEVSSKTLESLMLKSLHGGIDQILRVKAPILMEEILTPKPGKILQCVLVEGAPGVGKTTLAWQACKEWGKGKLFQHFALVILVRLRDQTVQNAQSITDLIFYRYNREEISQHLIQTDGNDVLIILEGLDELPTHFLMQSSIFTRLLSGQELPHATILVTSRPSATVYLWMNWKHRVSRHIEVLGFTEENISEYIASVLPPQELPGFQDYLSINTHIKTTMYIPLHAAIVIEVYRWCQHPRKPLPNTITQLYTCLVNIILRRYIDSHPDYKGKETHLQTFTDLPPPVYAHFYSLTQLAYTGVTQQKLIFQDQDQPIHHLGFMDAVTELFPSFDNQQVSYSYNFLHLSIQEYLAAYYISTMAIHEQEKLLGTICEQKHLQNMARFLAGITHFKDMDRAIVKRIIKGEGKEEAINLSTQELQLLYECRDASILDSNDFYVCPLTDHNALFDFSALGYCITHSNCKWKLQLGDIWGMKSKSRIEMLVQELNNHTNPSYLYSIELIEFHYDAPECVEQLLAGLPKNVLPQIQTLELSSRYHNSLLPQCVPEFTLKMSSLHTLRLDNTKGVTAVHRTVQAVISTNTIRKLTLNKCDIDRDCVTTLSSWLSTSSQLETLEIQLPSPEFTEMIPTALITNSTLKELNLRGSKFNLQTMQAMCSLLTYSNTISKVKLKYCSIDSDLICCLAKGLPSNTILTTLDISSNLISDRGAESIAQALHSNNTLTTLNISISHRGAESIAQALHSNNTLTTLDIGGSSISDRGAESIAQALHSNNTLTTLDISKNSISDIGAESIARALHSNNTLTTLDIGDNSISDRGAESIAQALHSNNTLTTLNIRHNTISDGGAESIAQALHSNNTLTTLNICHNTISDGGAICMTEMLKINNTLQEVDLSENSIGSEGLMALREIEETKKHIKLIIEFESQYELINPTNKSA